MLVEVLWSWQFRAVHANAEEAQAAISQQPLFAPRNEALQDNEHFKTAIPTTPTTRLSQHSDIGWDREKEGGEEKNKRVSWICQSHTFCFEWWAEFIRSAVTTLITQQTSDYVPYNLPHLAACTQNGPLTAYLCFISLCKPLITSLAFSCSVSKQSGRQTKILITKSLCSFSFYSC